MTFRPFEPRPDGYIAKEAIYSILRDMQEQGVQKFENLEISRIIQEKYHFFENVKTISSYKSQYFNHLKKDGSRPFSKNESDIAKIIRLNRDLRPVLLAALQDLHGDKAALISVTNATIEALD